MEDVEQLRRQLEAAESKLRIAESKVAKQSLPDFLRCCHNVCILTKPIHDPSRTTKGLVSDPTHRLYPHLIRSWDDFSVCQAEVWTGLSKSESFWTAPAFASTSDFDHMRRRIEPITSEVDLIKNQFLTTEYMVKEILSFIEEDDEIDLPGGHVSFEGTHFLTDRDVPLDDALQSLSISVPPEPSAYRRNRRADQLCVLQRTDDGDPLPLLAIEYKAPHKLTVPIISMGLQSDIRPAQEIINSYEDSAEFRSRNAMAAVITQLFSYMIGIGIRYGYITSGEAYVFVHIEDDPSIVRYSVSIPKDDCEQDPQNWKERTAVAQVFAFIQQALAAKPADQAWMKRAHEKLEHWEVEFYNILDEIPETERASRDHSVYKPRAWKRKRVAPIQLRNRCVPPTRAAGSNSSDDSAEDSPPPGPSRRQPNDRTPARSDSKESNTQTGRSGPGTTTRPTSAQGRPYCSHGCLLGLIEGLSIDPRCPNAASHGTRHLPKHDFLRKLCDRDKDADFQPLDKFGAQGALLRVCLTSHGYTLVAKGVAHLYRRGIANEEFIYNRLRELQGEYVPACGGLITLKSPYYYQGVPLLHLLLMSWAGGSLVSSVRRHQPLRIETLKPLSIKALSEIHRLGVLHCDAEPRNVLYDPVSSAVMFVDFERSKVLEANVLAEISPNRTRRKNVSAADGKARQATTVHTGPFAMECRQMVQLLEQAFKPRVLDAGTRQMDVRRGNRWTVSGHHPTCR